jgi:ParB family chromosome partitioning protein
VFESQRLEAQIADLNAQLSQVSSERGAQRLDPHSIAPSRWANRHPDSFSGPAFDELKREIQDAGGNVQPIKVRPLKSRKADSDGPRYEIVFGHRRHRACLELGLPVLAVVEEVDDGALFVQMERENRGRESLSAWEQGRMYLRAIDEGLYSSNIKLAAAIGRDPSDIGKATRIAKLPSEVTSAFSSPNAIQFRWAADLERALKEHRAEVLLAARELSARTPRINAAEVFAQLTACLRAPAPRASSVRKIELGGGRSALLRQDERGRTTVEMSQGVLPMDRWDAFEQALKRVLE